MSPTGEDLTHLRVAQPALVVAGVRRAYGPTVALDGIDLTVDAGTILGLLGPNGAGKTTLVSIVAGIKRADAGRVAVAGTVGYAPQETGVYPTLTVRENLRYFGGLTGLRRRELRDRIDEVGGALGLTALFDRRASQISGGERRRLHTAIALVHRPQLVLLDEPTTGADVRTRREILALVRSLAESGSAVVYSTHYLHEIEELSATVAFIDHGRIVARGSLSELVERFGSSALVLRFDGQVPASACVAGAVVDGSSVRVPTADPAGTAARLLPQLGPDTAGLLAVEVVRPSLESVFLTVTGRRYEPAA
jgi:ABC-2 type transport system ATP-binding protein